MSDPHFDRIQRILDKLTHVRRKGLNCFGAESHKFRLNPPIDEASLSRFEQEHRINLPLDYRSFLKFAGNGGAGPYYGIYQLDQWNEFLDWTTDDIPTDILAQPCPLYQDMPREEDWASQFCDCVSPYQGMISIGSQGCTYGMGLIVTGTHVGRVVYLDADGQPPYVVREPDFFSWYERWLDELLGGYEISWFGFGMGGNESEIMERLAARTTSLRDRIDAIHALCRLPGLSPQGKQKICQLISDPAAGIRAAACTVVEKFKIREARRFLTDRLHDESAEVRMSAIGMCAAISMEDHSEDIVKLLQSDDSDVAKKSIPQTEGTEQTESGRPSANGSNVTARRVTTSGRSCH